MSGELEIHNPGYHNLSKEWIRDTNRKKVDLLNRACDIDLTKKSQEGVEQNMDLNLKSKLRDFKKKIDNKEYVKISDSEWYHCNSRNIIQIIEAYIIILVQFLEYKIDYFLTKSFESLYGYSSILPSAF